MLPQLYLHGLSSGDFELAMRGLLGESAPLSASSIARLRDSWTAEFITWKQRPFKDKEIVYLWVDGIYVKAGLEKEKAALLVVVGALSDGTKEVLAVECGQKESEASWSAILRDLKARGMNCPRLVMGDGHLGIWSALANVYPDAQEQRCWNHRMRNVLDNVGKKRQGEAKELLRKVMYAPTLKQAEAAKKVFCEWARSYQYEKAASLLDLDWERMVAYYSFPKEHWQHLRTTNIVESPFASVRLRTAASKRYKRVAGATVMIWKLLMIAEQTFRKLNAPHLLAHVMAGLQYQDGELIGNPMPERTIENRLAA
jgi:transposase-like protein